MSETKSAMPMVVYAVCYWGGRVEALFSTEAQAHTFLRASSTTRGNTSRYEVIEYPVDAAYASVVCPDASPEVETAMATEPGDPTPAPGPPPPTQDGS